MRLLVLGAGVVGRCVAIEAARMPHITGVTVADRDFERASAVAAAIGGSAVQLDVTDELAMAKAMRDVEIVGSAVGPATRFSMPVFKSVLAAKRHFVEVSDDPHPILALLAMNDEATAAGITAIVGCGASPGITNLLAVAAASKLDRVDRLVTCWGSAGKEDGDDEDDAGEGVTAALEHWVEQVSQPIPVWRGGRIATAEPLEVVRVDYPGIGAVSTRLVGHPEPVTLPLKYPGLQESLNVMDFSSYIFACLEKVSEGCRSGKLTYRQGAEQLAVMLDGDDASLSATKAASFAYHASKDVLGGKKWLPPLCAVAEGAKAGRAAIVGASLSGAVPGGMGPITAIPAAIVIDMIAGGAQFGAGAQAVEAAIRPDLFFDRLRPYLRGEDGGPIAEEEPTISIVEQAGRVMEEVG